MCYNIKTLKTTQLKRAFQEYSQDEVDAFSEELERQASIQYYQVSGFAHPKIVIYTNHQPFTPVVSTWGLVPSWVKDEQQKQKIWNSTLNARGETLFEKPSFRASAKSKRCIIPIDGFYEHHHFKGKIYPFFISRADSKPVSLAGLWSEWTNKATGELLNTFSIVTTTGNEMMAEIHNNPKASGPRMPVILPEESEEKWLAEINDELDIGIIKELIKPLSDKNLKAHTVRKLRGKESIGNDPKASEEYRYEVFMEKFGHTINFPF